jgi:hypothetical protein
MGAIRASGDGLTFGDVQLNVSGGAAPSYTFLREASIAATPYDAVRGDFNGDGELDVALLLNFGSAGNGNTVSAIQVILSLATTNTRSAMAAPLPLLDGGIFAGDFDGDGYDDLGVYQRGSPNDHLLTLFPMGPLQ